MDNTRELLMKKGSEYSVFCYDIERDEIILVKTSNETDLYECACMYVAQRINAIEALYIPLIMAISLSNELAVTFPVDFQLIHLYNVGRCGSTLLCKAMNATEDCQSLSEPDFFTGLYNYGM
ncbi:unnamed protein product [Rotaria sordida]|uniref:Uncharacterized protein n=1 Tax=Rotaria sordida TaxID=392033 RepID=A0A814PJ19_9BILA|nr:unnamed protein product [Rotaria sordida]CAF1106265.1 unnamed protein product [Rotaria sordida]